MPPRSAVVALFFVRVMDDERQAAAGPDDITESPVFVTFAELGPEALDPDAEVIACDAEALGGFGTRNGARVGVHEDAEQPCLAVREVPRTVGVRRGSGFGVKRERADSGATSGGLAWQSRLRGDRGVDDERAAESSVELDED